MDKASYPCIAPYAPQTNRRLLRYLAVALITLNSKAMAEEVSRMTFPRCAELAVSLGAPPELENVYVNSKNGWTVADSVKRSDLPRNVSAVYVTPTLGCESIQCSEKGFVLIKIEKTSIYKQVANRVNMRSGSSSKKGNIPFDVTQYNAWHKNFHVPHSETLSNWHVEYKSYYNKLTTYFPRDKKLNFVFTDTQNNKIRDSLILGYTMRLPVTKESNVLSVFDYACVDFSFENNMRGIKDITISIFDLETGAPPDGITPDGISRFPVDTEPAMWILE